MGNNDSSLRNPTPNVRERHSKALYVNVPVSMEQVKENLPLLPPCEADTFNGKCWISIVIDDLDSLESWTGVGFMPTGMQGWMCKVNLLVKHASLIPGETVHAYQILTLDFENNWGGVLKVLGAKATQGIPTFSSSFASTFGKSGSTFDAPIIHGAEYSVIMQSLSSSSSSSGRGSSISNSNNTEDESFPAPLVSIRGRLCCEEIPEEVQSFMKFVVDRPHKLLAYKGSQLAYSKESGVGSHCTSQGCVTVVPNDGDKEAIVLHVLNRVNIDTNSIDRSAVICFIQPYYTIVDHKNSFL